MATAPVTKEEPSEEASEDVEEEIDDVEDDEEVDKEEDSAVAAVASKLTSDAVDNLLTIANKQHGLSYDKSSAKEAELSPSGDKKSSTPLEEPVSSFVDEIVKKIGK